MVALTALAMAVSAAASVAGVVSAENAKRDAKKQAKKQETMAKEAAALEAPLQKGDPNFQLGTDDPTARSRTSAARSVGSKPGSTLTTGGLSASSVGGL